MINTGIKILLGLTACMAGGNVYASCEMVQRSDLSVPASPIIGTVALNATVSAPADMPLGTILYRGVFNRPIQVAIKCTEQGQFYTLQKMATSAGTLGKAEDFNSPVPVGSVVFKTSMPGVGFALNSGYTVYDVPHAAAVCVNSSNCIWNGDSIVNAASIMYLIKTGPITPGTIIGASLPVYSELFGQDGFMVTTMAMPFTGSITVPPPSCTTPDVAVEMGTWSVGDFRGKGSGTEWQDASIRMTGCDNFYGYRAGHNLDNGGTASLSEPVYKNKYTVSLSPSPRPSTATAALCPSRRAIIQPAAWAFK